MASRQKKISTSNMKKDKEKEKETGDKSTNRPTSAQLTNNNKEKNIKKDEKQSKQEEKLLAQNAEVQLKVEQLTTENKQVKDKLLSVSRRIIDESRNKGFELNEEERSMTILDVPVDSMLALIHYLVHGKVKLKQKGTAEGRLEELETRITHLNLELSKLLRTRLDLENGLEEIQECETLAEVQRKAKTLLYDAQGSRLFSCLEDVQDDEDEIPIFDPSKTSPILPKEMITVQSITKDLQTFELNPPEIKLPGETHIRNMHQGLKDYIAYELSLYKGNGADWRMFGERVGIDPETIAQWKRWKVDRPMRYVLDSWGQSPGATMRLLHRHLVSPQMRCILLAKRVGDFYQVT